MGFAYFLLSLRFSEQVRYFFVDNIVLFGKYKQMRLSFIYGL